MSRSRTRARNRRARLEKDRAEFREKRRDPEALENMLRRLAGSDTCVWAVAGGADDEPLDEAERAMIAQIVAPRLAGMTPGAVRSRHERSGRAGPATMGTGAQEPRGTSHVSGLTPRR